MWLASAAEVRLWPFPAVCLLQSLPSGWAVTLGQGPSLFSLLHVSSTLLPALHWDLRQVIPRPT